MKKFEVMMSQDELIERLKNRKNVSGIVKGKRELSNVIIRAAHSPLQNEKFRLNKAEISNNSAFGIGIKSGTTSIALGTPAERESNSKI